jgi:cytochrome c peroxidase
MRNIELTAPYMHDGSIATLGEVLDHYAAGGRTIADGPLAGVGHDNPHKDKLIRGFRMTPRNRADLLAFLASLTDQNLIRNPALSDPRVAQESTAPAFVSNFRGPKRVH